MSRQYNREDHPLWDIADVLTHGIFLLISKLVKLIWKPMAFTGTLPFFLLVFISANSSEEERNDLGVLVFLSLLFAVGWTAKNLYNIHKEKRHYELARQYYRGVFFGLTGSKNERSPVGKRMKEDGHILVVGGAGTGKSSCIAIPTLKYHWDSRFLAVDIKGELAEKSGRKACIFNPCKPEAYGYDPFRLVQDTNNPIAQIRSIALTIAPEPKEVKDPFWIQAAQNILTGHLLFNFKYDVPFLQTLHRLQSEEPKTILRVAAKDTEAAMFVSQYMGMKEETLASVMSTLSNYVIPFLGDTDIQAALSKKEIITPKLLEEGQNIFLQMPEHKINQWKSLITLILQQFLTHFEQRPEGSKTPVLFMVDEFARFGKMEAIINGLATLRSKKVTICLIIQSLAQLDAIYGQDYRKIIADNCAYKAILGATDADTQKYFSSLVGTEMVEQESYTKDVSSPFKFQQKVQSVNISKVERPKMKPESFANLSLWMIVLSPEGYRMVSKVPYYRQDYWQPIAQQQSLQNSAIEQKQSKWGQSQSPLSAFSEPYRSQFPKDKDVA